MSVVKSSEAISKLNALIEQGPPTKQTFQKFVRWYFKKHGRSFPWRETRDPYAILVSEVMLQQTQTDRVVPKYQEFLKRFPTWRSLSEATPAEVIRLWMGLGYYRRAMNLREAARYVVKELDGKPPRDANGLRVLPGVGPYTASAVAAFAFDQPSPMIETNIRTVYLHVFFPHGEGVSDTEILPLVEETLDIKAPREWFYALMDLGVALKSHVKGIHHRSRHHVKQSRFEGSTRQVRAAVLRLLTHRESVRRQDVSKLLTYDPAKIDDACSALVADGLLTLRRGKLMIVQDATR